MSTIIKETRICDRCKKEMKHPGIQMIRGNLKVIGLKWWDSCRYDGRMIDLCKFCAIDLKHFLEDYKEPENER